MKMKFGFVACGMMALATTLAGAQALVPETAPAPEEVAVAAPAVEAAAPAEIITVKGEVSVVNGPDGALEAIYINPAEGHGYKVDIVNGTGSTLADKDGKIVEATGVDANRLFNIQSVSVVE